jgi:predicted metal-dependent hydrolase
MSQKIFTLEGIGSVTVQKRRGNRSLRLTLTSRGVRVTIPTWTPYAAGVSFAQSKRAWIAANAPTAHAELQNGQAIGRNRRLTFARDPDITSPRTSVRSNEVVVWYGPENSPADASVQRAAELACWRALKAESNQLLTPRLNELAAQHGFAYRSLNFKRMKSRWGSCDQRHNIVINIFLIQLPWDCIDYVLLHELTHTRALHHGPDFWSAMERVLPGARRYLKRMRGFQPTLQPNHDTVA